MCGNRKKEQTPDPAPGKELEVEEIVKRSYTLATRYISRFGFSKMDAEDVIQEILCAAYAKRHTLKDVDKYDYWLRKIAVNEALQYIRKSNKNVLPSENIVEILDYHQLHLGLPDVLEVLQQEELICEIQHEVKKLSQKYCQVLELYYFEGYNLQQAADIMHINYNTAKTLHSRALKKLKPVMAGLAKENLRSGE